MKGHEDDKKSGAAGAERKEPGPNAPRSSRDSAHSEGSTAPAGQVHGTRTQAPGTDKPSPPGDTKAEMVRNEQREAAQQEKDRAGIVDPKFPQTGPAAGQAPESAQGRVMLVNRSSETIRVQLEVKGGEGGKEWVGDSVVEVGPNDQTGLGIEAGRRVIVDVV